MEKIILRLKQVNLIDTSIVLMMISMFIIGRICADSYQGTAENFVLLDWWNLGMYGSLKYILYNTMFIVLLYRHRKWLLLPYGFYSLFSIKDFIQFFIDYNIEDAPEDYIMFCIGLIFIALFYYITKQIAMKKDNPDDSGTQLPHPPSKPKE